MMKRGDSVHCSLLVLPSVGFIVSFFSFFCCFSHIVSDSCFVIGTRDTELCIYRKMSDMDMYPITVLIEELKNEETQACHTTPIFAPCQCTSRCA